MSQDLKAVTVRMTKDLYRQTVALARREGLSLSGYLLQSLERQIERERQQQLYEAFTLIGEDAESGDVEFAVEAQRHVCSED